MAFANLSLNQSLSRTEVFDQVRKEIESSGYKITEENLERPWGGYFRISDSQIDKFTQEYFSTTNLPENAANLSPKIMVLAPNTRLSWQVHERRDEIWRVVK
ncbi:MAG: hypothetical protein Q7R49_01665 [Candidatus Daviesbacteria bacterium]|nr:hypothetical protein [Candidatus Daviesbacteria bacterium]